MTQKFQVDPCVRVGWNLSDLKSDLSHRSEARSGGKDDRGRWG